MNGVGLLVLALLGSPPSPVSAEVPVYVMAELPDETLNAALAEVDRIFAGAGVHWRWRIDPESASELPVVTVLVQEKPLHPVIQGCHLNLHDHRLGHTHFSSRRITVWTEQVARTIDGDWDAADVPEVNETLLARALGRVLAHELGHFFLDSTEHRRRGLMRESLSRRSLIAKTRGRVRLSRRDMETIYTALAIPVRGRLSSSTQD